MSRKKESVSRKQITISEDCHNKLKVIAALEGKKINEFTDFIIDSYCKKNYKELCKALENTTSKKKGKDKALETCEELNESIDLKNINKNVENNTISNDTENLKEDNSVLTLKKTNSINATNLENNEDDSISLSEEDIKHEEETTINKSQNNEESTSSISNTKT
ncbi:MAG: hypothetical protein E7J38_10950, partial [Streptococcus salivarius]|nr:hypothetical protein [Streptococcus salivarius]